MLFLREHPSCYLFYTLWGWSDDTWTPLSSQYGSSCKTEIRWKTLCCMNEEFTCAQTPSTHQCKVVIMLEDELPAVILKHCHEARDNSGGRFALSQWCQSLHWISISVTPSSHVLGSGCIFVYAQLCAYIQVNMDKMCSYTTIHTQCLCTQVTFPDQKKKRGKEVYCLYSY